MNDDRELAKQLAHDVLNALSVLLAKQEAILKHENLKDIYDIAHSSIERIQNLASLCKSKIEGPIKSSFNIGELLKKSLQDIQKDFPKLKVQIINNFDLILNIDASEFLNASLNILKNATESEATELSILVEKKGIYFYDNGTGMTHENLTRIRNFKSTKKDGHGIGLLSIAHFCRSNGLVMKFKNNKPNDIYSKGFCVYFSLDQ